MQIQFSKYQATGNDFIVIDGDSNKYPTQVDELMILCHRRFGIGADGVIIVKKHPEYDFEVIYYNPDGSRSFCGNGTRSAIIFANQLGLVSAGKTRFLAFDGVHTAEIIGENLVRLEMRDVHSVRFIEDGIFVDTGSPHLVRFVEDLDTEKVVETGRHLRYGAPIEGGTNVNFVQKTGDSQLTIRTYERGVEDETYSCGTGVTASALAASFENMSSPVQIKTKGGDLSIEYVKSEQDGFSSIFLTGPAKCVFEGEYNLKNSYFSFLK